MAQFTLTRHDLEMELWLRERMRDELVWTTRSGERISLRDMSDEHIKNALRYMENMETLMDARCSMEAENIGDR